MAILQIDRDKIIAQLKSMGASHNNAYQALGFITPLLDKIENGLTLRSGIRANALEVKEAIRDVTHILPRQIKFVSVSHRGPHDKLLDDGIRGRELHQSFAVQVVLQRHFYYATIGDDLSQAIRDSVDGVLLPALEKTHGHEGTEWARIAAQNLEECLLWYFRFTASGETAAIITHVKRMIQLYPTAIPLANQAEKPDVWTCLVG